MNSKSGRGDAAGFFVSQAFTHMATGSGTSLQRRASYVTHKGSLQHFKTAV